MRGALAAKRSRVVRVRAERVRRLNVPLSWHCLNLRIHAAGLQTPAAGRRRAQPRAAIRRPPPPRARTAA